jgi:hypothetical protein
MRNGRSGAEESRTPDLLNAIRFPALYARLQLTTIAEKIKASPMGEPAAVVRCGPVNP